MKNKILVLVALLSLTACGGSGGGGPPPEPIVDYQLMECFKLYRWNGLFNTWECPDGGWHAVSNQPIFTSADDCHVAKHIVQQGNPNIWDEHDEAKKDLLRSAGSAYFLSCWEL